MPEAMDREPETVSVMFSDGEVLMFPKPPELSRPTHGGVILNGGLPEVALLLASVAASGVVGNTAYDAVKLGLRSLRLRLSWGSEDDHRRYVAYIAQLSVAAKLDQRAVVTVASCTRDREGWSAVVLADDRTYRVQIPLMNPRPTAISVDLD
jgi:hypothetical protein